jgi:hypothetical protein
VEICGNMCTRGTEWVVVRSLSKGRKSGVGEISVDFNDEQEKFKEEKGREMIR